MVCCWFGRSACTAAECYGQRFALMASHFSLRGQRKVTKRKATPTTRPFGFAALLGLTGDGRTRLFEPQTCCRPLSREPCATRPRKRGPGVRALVIHFGGRAQLGYFMGVMRPLLVMCGFALLAPCLITFILTSSLKI